MTIYLRALSRSATLFGVALAASAQLAFSFVVLGPGILLGLVLLLPRLVYARRFTNRWRRLFGEWLGQEIPVPYRPPPPPPEPDDEGLYRHDTTLYRKPFWPTVFQRLDWLVHDPATGRDLRWQLCFPVVVLLLVPVGLPVAPLTVRAIAAWSARLLGPSPEHPPEVPKRRSKRVEAALLAWARCGLLVVSAALQLVLLVFSVACFGLGFGAGFVFLIPVAVSHFRWLANLHRQWAGWGGVRIARPYTRKLEPELRPDGLYRVGKGLYKTEAMAQFNARWLWTWSDLASWRDLLWLVTNPVMTVAQLGVAVLAGVYGAWGLALPWVWTEVFGAEWSAWYGAVAGHRTLGLVAGVALVVASVALAPVLLPAHARWTAVLLRPTRAAALRQRVERLTRTRADAVDAQATEVRRIERDLHDGAQARLIAVGLTLGAIERLMDTDPAAARRLVAQARETSQTALAELRDLVRGIHPPVLSERGLPDAVRALALDSAAEVTVLGHLPGRLAAPVESAAYFAVSELLANAVRHGRAERITVDLRHHEGLLRVTVTDDGDGGADPSRGTGLRGIERRLGTFDGTLAVHSPSGGPTVATLELPCALSSPKTSTS